MITPGFQLFATIACVLFVVATCVVVSKIMDRTEANDTEFYDILEQIRHDAHHRQLGFDLEGSKKELKRQKAFIKLTSLGFVASVTFLVTVLIRRKRNRE